MAIKAVFNFRLNRGWTVGIINPADKMGGVAMNKRKSNNGKSNPKNAPRTHGASGSKPKEQLTAEVRRLKKKNRILKQERDSYRQFVMAKVKQSLSRAERDELIRNSKNPLPLQDFLHEIDGILRGD